MAAGEEKPQLRGCEAPVVRRSEKEHAERLLLRLKADGYDAAKTLRERQFAESADGLFFFERREGVVAQVAKTQQAAEARHQADEIIVQAFVLGGAAEIITQAHVPHGSRPPRLTLEPQ